MTRAPRLAGLALTTVVLASSLAGCSSAPARPAGGAPSGGASAPSGASQTPGAAPTLKTGRDTPAGGGWSKRPVAVGRAVMMDYAGPASGLTMSVHVWLPPQYDDPANAGKRFPVVVAFPGGAGASGAAFLSHGLPPQIEANIKAGKTPPFIIVEPQMQVSESKDTECTDLPGQPKVGTFLEQDVPALVKKSFAVLPQRTAWAVTGVSSGAYCAARLGMHRPDVFAVAAPVDGYFAIDSNLAAGKTDQAKATSPLALAAAAPDLTILGWYGTGKGNDQLSKHRSEKFAAAVRPPTTYTATEVPGGAHLWTTYSTLLPDVLTTVVSKLDPAQ